MAATFRKGLALIALLSVPLAPAASSQAAEYPSVPYALPNGPAALFPVFDGNGAPLDLWLGTRGSLRRLSVGADGSLGVVESARVPPGAVPVALAEDVRFFYIVDSATGALLVFPRLRGGALGVPQRLPVGVAPTSVTVGCSGCTATSPQQYVAVANSGSGDLSVYTWDGDSAMGNASFSSERRVTIGGSPVAVRRASSGDRRVAVAAGAAGTVTVLDASKGFTSVAELKPGGVVADVQWAGWSSDAPFGAPGSDLVVADASAPRVRVFSSSGSGFAEPKQLDLPGQGATANAVALADLNADKHDDVIVADRSSRSLVVFDGLGNGQFAAARTIRTGIDVATLLAGDYGGDWQHPDLAVTDLARHKIALLLTPGDAQVVPGVDGQSLSADAGVLAWSHMTSSGVYRLAVRQGATTGDVSAGAASKPLVSRVGRRAPGKPVIAYVACRKGRCLPYTWDLSTRRERPISIRVAKGCRLATVAVWDTRLAYDVQAGTKRCPSRARGVWLRSGRRPAVRRGSGSLGDLRNGYLAWLTADENQTQLVRVASLTGRPRTIATSSIDNHGWLEPPTITGRSVVYGSNNGGEGQGGIDLFRLRLDRRGACQQMFSDAPRMAVPQPTSVSYAVDRDNVFYTDPSDIGHGPSRGIFQIDSAREHWTTDCSLTH